MWKVWSGSVSVAKSDSKQLFSNLNYGFTFQVKPTINSNIVDVVAGIHAVITSHNTTSFTVSCRNNTTSTVSCTGCNSLIVGYV